MNARLRSLLYLSVLSIVSLSIFLGYSSSRFVESARAANFIVINNNDNGVGSLRQPILGADANPGLDSISFNTPSAGVQPITLASDLPLITQPLSIDGYT